MFGVLRCQSLLRHVSTLYGLSSGRSRSSVTALGVSVRCSQRNSCIVFEVDILCAVSRGRSVSTRHYHRWRYLRVAIRRDHSCCMVVTYFYRCDRFSVCSHVSAFPLCSRCSISTCIWFVVYSDKCVSSRSVPVTSACSAVEVGRSLCMLYSQAWNKFVYVWP
jgi:hypothetical protein